MSLNNRRQQKTTPKHDNAKLTNMDVFSPKIFSTLYKSLVTTHTWCSFNQPGLLETLRVRLIPKSKPSALLLHRLDPLLVA